MNYRSTVVAFPLLAIALLVSGCPPPPLDHFKAYDVADEPSGITVVLEDQFDQFLGIKETVVLTALTRFSNPVDKNGEGIVNPFAHLTWYTFDGTQPVPGWQITLRNQFGEDQWIVGDPKVLLVPAEKIEPGSQPPTGLSHFKCYEALSGTPGDVTVTLQDQFDEGGDAKEFFVGDPIYFCNPVQKNDEPIPNTTDHLACYDIDPKEQIDRAIQAEDQFGLHDLQARRSEILCVPSEKLDFAPF